VKATIVGCAQGDWQGLYIDGKRLDGVEGHSLRIDEVLEALGYQVERIETSDSWMEDNSNPLPESLAAIPEGA
jgi:hypothetical protein